MSGHLPKRGVSSRGRGNKWTRMVGDAHNEGRLQARPAAEAAKGAPVGLRPLPPTTARDGYLYVPASYRAERPAPLALLLHGAGESALDGLALLRAQADAAELILLAPASHDYTWDLISGRHYGPDVAGIDRALEHVFYTYRVDPGRVAVGDTPTGPPMRSRSGSPTATSSRTCSRSRRGSWRPRVGRARRASSSRTARVMGGCRSIAAAAG